MLPVVDYGSIAIVIPQITAVGSLVEESDRCGFEVFLSGMNEPVMITFETSEQAIDSREELIGIIAQYHYMKDLGPDFDPAELFDLEDEEDEESDPENEFDLKKDIN